jgi:hypothetical protein
MNTYIDFLLEFAADDLCDVGLKSIAALMTVLSGEI